ncbi:MAG TPA: Ig-like domain repeat protein, partial [Bacteroidota bacterium]|nr:Ig-like domain repeat protein [Bacteroidota bacterium]
VTITRDENPTTANAGSDETVCATTTTLAGNTPSVGTGIWTVIAGGASVTTPGDPTSGVTELTVGANTFVWTISNLTCPSSKDTVTITRDANPTSANAGPDATVCVTTATLAGNTPSLGSGLWTVIAGGATVTFPVDPTSGVTGLSVGANIFVWTISNGTCPSSKDTVTITRDEAPTTANAGPDEEVCSTTTTLAGNTATVGTGLWVVVSGSGSVTTPGDPASGVTGLSVGLNAFEWMISSGTCPTTRDTVMITRFAPPTTADAGSDQQLCSTTSTLAGNTPSTGAGVWTVIAGSATVTTPSDPASGVTGLSLGVNSFVWTISNGVCTPSKDTVTITRDEGATASNAGSDQQVCSTTAILAGNAPSVGTGLWTVIAGGATITTPVDSVSGVTGLSVGANTFVWTITSGTCPPSKDTVTIVRDEPPTTANAGSDQTVCAPTTTLAGNIPTVGTGSWLVLSGGATVTVPGDPASGVTGLLFGSNMFEWMISNGVCPVTRDTVTITRDQGPTAANAGSDQQVCATTTTLAGNAPAVGTGLWTVIAGSASVTTPADSASGVTGLSVGANTFVWTISNGICPATKDTVTITRFAPPTAANAGPDQSVCSPAATLAGNTLTVGTGTWTVLSGGASVTVPSDPASGVTGLSVGVNMFEWMTSNGVCAVTKDTVTITRDQGPTAANAGTDQQVCSTTATLAGNAPVVGTGTWTVIAGSASVTIPADSASGVTGLSVGANTFVWTISNGTCSPSKDTVTITRYAPPTTANAGPDQSVCSAATTLAGNTATVGTGVWTVIAGTASVTVTGNPTSGVTGLSVGVNSFVWTVSNGTCAPSKDTVTITRDQGPSAANAGPDQQVCSTTAALAGNAPGVGSGLWTVIAGSATVATPADSASGVTGLSVGANTFVWTISNGTCPATKDTVTITRFAPPTTANAGPDQTISGTAATLAGNAPVVGSGVWTVLSGTGSVTTPSNPTSGVTGLSVGANLFRWTISNGTCQSSSDTVNIKRKDPTTSTLASYVNPSSVGQPVTFRDSVSGSAPNGGKVQFKVDNVAFGDSVAIDGNGIALLTTSTLAAGNHSVQAFYGGTADYDPSTSNIVSQTVSQLSITATAGSNGSITPSGTVSISYDSTQNFTITPNVNYHIDSVVVDGGFVGTSASYSFTHVIANHTIRAVFKSDAFATPVVDGWNLISDPMVGPDQRKSVVYPTAISSAFSYAGRYVEKDTIEDGLGYWLKFSGSQSVTVYGNPLTQDTIDVRNQWQMIGSISTPVKVEHVVEVPFGLVASFFYGYDSGYYPVDTIVPGNGYWVRTNAVGKLVLDASGGPSANSVPRFVEEGAAEHLNTLTFDFSNRRKLQLMLGAKSFVGGSLSRYDLPPVPPTGSFDARFASNRSLEVHGDNLEQPVEFPLAVQSPLEEIRLAWSMKDQNNLRYSLVQKTQRGTSRQKMDGNGSTVLSLAEGTRYAIRVEQIPTVYTLGQNYPNPFNPTTNIRFDLPVASVVTLKVYNLLGQEITTLLDHTQMEEGMQAASFDGQQLTSGVYLYRIIAEPVSGGAASGKFTSVRKMVLLK